MGIFSKKDAAVAATDEKVVIVPSHVQGGVALSEVIIAPRITEKSAKQSEENVYAFEINARANKHQVAQAVAAFYKVTPVKVAIVNVPTKYAKNWKTGRTQVKKPGMKKAMVYVKKGETIAFV